jgi:hypothetical protein
VPICPASYIHVNIPGLCLCGAGGNRFHDGMNCQVRCCSCKQCRSPRLDESTTRACKRMALIEVESKAEPRHARMEMHQHRCSVRVQCAGSVPVLSVRPLLLSSSTSLACIESRWSALCTGSANVAVGNAQSPILSHRVSA